MRSILQTALTTILAGGLTAATAFAATDGTVKGNGMCYNDATGKYCGKAVDEHGNTVTKGCGCLCGTFLAVNNDWLTGLDLNVRNESLIAGVTLPEVGDSDFEVYAWDGAGWYFVAVVGAGEPVAIETPTQRVRILNINAELQIDPANATAFPLTIATVGGGPFTGGKVAFWPMPADLNDDHEVSIIDLSILLANFGGPGPGDISGDGRIDLIDLSMLLATFGESA